MSGFALFFVIVGIATCTNGMFKVIDWLEGGAHR